MAEKKTIKKTTKKTAAKKTVKKIKAESAIEVEVKPIETPLTIVEETADLAGKKKSEYLYGVGRRKTAIAQVRVYKKGDGKISVNNKDVKALFPNVELQDKILSPLKIVGQMDKLAVTVIVQGGGKVAQAEAIRHGISRALLLLNPNFRKPLKKADFLTRDSRKKERKKPGLKRARKAPQWTKR